MPRVRGRAILAQAARVVRQVIGCVPAVLGRVDPAAEGQSVVGHDNLLVVAGAEGVMAVQRKMNPVATEKAER